jgi:hypothetical protein
MNSNTGSKAQEELDILLESIPSDDKCIIEEFIPEILALVDKFGESGQSGGSAPYVSAFLADVVKKLCMQEPISPITGVDDEWGIVSYPDMNHKEIYQNKRCGSLFKENGKVHYLNAIVWKTQKGLTLCGSAQLHNGNEILSRQFIKGFPFIPKTFYVDVIEEETSKDNWVFHIKDEKQLDKVFEYYEKGEII